MVPGSEVVFLDGDPLNDRVYSITYRRGFLELRGRDPSQIGQLVITYSYIPISVADSFRKWPIRYPDMEAPVGQVRRSLTGSAGQPSSYAGSRLRRSGSITRGITTGTSRDVAIESGLRLQVDGQIVEGLDLRAVLTDESTPILPEGSTQRLNEFDRVFIELKSSLGTVQLGDFDGNIDGGEFAQLTRKLQGATVFGRVGARSGALFQGGSIVALGATSRGIFRVQELHPIDGVQGPYRLEGKKGERFIILLPGSEVVYVDGQRKQRGESNDYVVDYTTGEITFMPGLIVTPDLRISVEFQYTTEQFTRTMVAADVETGFGISKNGNPILSIGASFIREVDGDQFNQQFSLTSSDSLAIVEAGDSDAITSGAMSVVYDSEAPFTQYVTESRQEPDGSFRDIFVAISKEPADSVQVYRVTFSRVGADKGSYERTGLVTNGIAYEYVGDGNGDYEPVSLLPVPAFQQLFDLRMSVQPVSAFKVSGEWASSLLDLNRLSDLDAEDDKGDAYRFGFSIEPFDLTINDASIGTVSASYHHRFRNVKFSTFERVRPIEYARKWNIQSQAIDATGGIEALGNEISNEASLRWAFADSSDASATYARLQLGDAFTGDRLEGLIRLRPLRFPGIDYRIENISSEDHSIGQRGSWLRQFARISKSFDEGRLATYLEVEYENLRQKALANDSLLAPSITFLESRMGMRFLRKHYSIRTDIERRDEERTVEGGRHPLIAWTVSTRFGYDPSRSFHSDMNVGYRIAKSSTATTVSSGADTARPDESFILHWNGRWRSERRGTTITWLYQAQTERSATFQEIYIRTGQERGEYVWLDENNDGVIQLEEFLPETTPDEGNYVRTFFPSDSLEAITSVRGRLRLEYQPIRNTTEYKSTLSRLLGGVRTISLVDFEEKSRDPERDNIYLLRFKTFRSAEHSLSGRLRLRQEVAFFRNNPKIDLNFAVQSATSLTELSAGEEERESRFARFDGRYQLSPTFSLRLTAERSTDILQSESFASRNYNILDTHVSPSLSWQVLRELQLILTATTSRKVERNIGGTATTIRVPFDVRYRIERKLDMLARFEVSSVDLTDAFIGRTAFEMTDGRGPGTSYLWRLTLQSNLSELLTATVSYDGRAPKGRDVIHNARFQLSARF